MTAINVFPKHILKSTARDQSIQAKKKLFCHLIVKKYLCKASWKFLIKIESTSMRKIEEQAPHLNLLYRGRTFRSSHWRYCIRKLFSKNLQYHRNPPCRSLFLKKFQVFRPAALLKRDPNILKYHKWKKHWQEQKKKKCQFTVSFN